MSTSLTDAVLSSKLILTPYLYIGLALVHILAARPNVVIYATARKLEYATDLQALASESAGNVRLVELHSGDEAAHNVAVARIEDEVGRLDVVIANAGMVSHIGPLREMSVQAFRDHFEVSIIRLPLVCGLSISSRHCF